MARVFPPSDGGSRDSETIKANSTTTAGTQNRFTMPLANILEIVK